MPMVFGTLTLPTLLCFLFTVFQAYVLPFRVSVSNKKLYVFYRLRGISRLGSAFIFLR